MTEFEREYELLSELLLNEQVKDRVNAVLEQIKAEIYEEFMTIDGGVHDESAIKCMQIIDKYRGNKE